MNADLIKKKVFKKLGLLLLPMSVKLICKTLKINAMNVEELQNLTDNKSNLIIAFWHGKMVVPWYYFRNKNITALISKSKDGEILSNLLHSFNYDVIRGSSNDGGKEAFSKMIESAKDKKSLAITVDGPKGPISKMKAGAVIISHRTGTPIFLLGVGYNKFYQLKSWDKFQIPKPFSKVNLLFSNKIDINSDLTKQELGLKIEGTEKMLNELQLASEKF